MVAREIKQGDERRCGDEKIGELCECPVAEEADIPVGGLDVGVDGGRTV